MNEELDVDQNSEKNTPLYVQVLIVVLLLAPLAFFIDQRSHNKDVYDSVGGYKIVCSEPDNAHVERHWSEHNSHLFGLIDGIDYIYTIRADEKLKSFETSKDSVDIYFPEPVDATVGSSITFQACKYRDDIFSVFSRICITPNNCIGAHIR